MWKKLYNWLVLSVALLLFSMFALDMCHTFVPVTLEKFSIKFTDNTQFIILTFVTFTLSILILFHRNRRIMQIRLCILNSLILLSYQIWIVAAFLKLREIYILSIASVFPTVCIVILMIAVKIIWKEEVNSIFDKAQQTIQKPNN